MDSIDSWKILRVLTTNSCNYNCPFCHNEGQTKPIYQKDLLKFNDYKIILDTLVGTSLSEVHFSGGEPFLNPETIEMIIYTNNSTTLEIGCATNASLIKEPLIEKLADTRIKLNIQFPSLNGQEFKIITQNGDLNKTIDTLNLLKFRNVDFGLNHVITRNNSNSVFHILEFALKNSFNIKLLPDLYDGSLIKIRNEIYQFLDSLSYRKLDKGTGAMKWSIRTFPDDVQVLYIEPPCYTHNFNQCKKFAEIRLLPDLKFQTCIKKPRDFNLNFIISEDNRDLIKNSFQHLWNNFTEC